MNVKRMHRLARWRAVALAGAAAAMWSTSASAALIWSSALDGNADAIVGADGVAGGTPTAAVDMNGNVGGAVAFDGVDDFFSITPSQTVFTAGSISIWANADSFTNSEAGAISVGESGAGTTQYFTLHKAWRGDLDDGASRLDVASTTTAPTDTWQHVVLTFAAQGDLKMYIDGTLQNEVQSLSGAAASYTMTNAWSIGTELSTTTARFFDGTLDDARIYNSELQQAEVTALFNAGPTYVPEPGAVSVLGLAAATMLTRRRRNLRT